MAKSSGLGARLFYGPYNVSGDITAIGNIGGGPAAMDCTGIDKGAFERLGGILDARLEATAWWNPGPAADAAHQVFKVLPTTKQQATYCHRATIGASAASLLGKQVNYDGTRGNDGAFSFAVNAQGSEGVPLEWGVLGTAGVRTDTTATSGASVDGLAATEFGLAAHLHLFSLTGTSVTVKLQESADNGAADAWADVTDGAFTVATGPTVERIQTAADQDVERYLRVVTTGTFTEAKFAVVIVRHEIERSY